MADVIYGNSRKVLKHYRGLNVPNVMNIWGCMGAYLQSMNNTT